MRHERCETYIYDEVLALLADAIVLMSSHGAPRRPAEAVGELREVLNKAMILAGLICVENEDG